MARIAAGLGYKRFAELLQNTDLSNAVYAYRKVDEQVGRLSSEDVAFLRNHGAMVLEGEGDHSGTIDELVAQGEELLGIPTNQKSQRKGSPVAGLKRIERVPSGPGQSRKDITHG